MPQRAKRVGGSDKKADIDPRLTGGLCAVAIRVDAVSACIGRARMYGRVLVVAVPCAQNRPGRRRAGRTALIFGPVAIGIGVGTPRGRVHGAVIINGIVAIVVNAVAALGCSGVDLGVRVVAVRQIRGANIRVRELADIEWMTRITEAIAIVVVKEREVPPFTFFRIRCVVVHIGRARGEKQNEDGVEESTFHDPHCSASEPSSLRECRGLVGPAAEPRPRGPRASQRGRARLSLHRG